ncbi:MAG: transcriptional regulator GcvA [Rhizobiaceae bacterium]
MTLNVPGTRALKTFEAAARHLNFTRAADELGLTPAAVSHQIKEIEDQLGVSLFTRTSRTIRLTEGGIVLLDATVDALDLLTRAAARARKMERGASLLRLTLSPTFASKWLMPRLASFRKTYADIELRFDITDLVRDFDLDDVDVGVRFGAGKYPGLCSHRLFDDMVIPVCSPALLSGDQPLREPRDLLNHTLCHVDWTLHGLTWPTWGMWMAAAGIEDFDDSRCVVFDDSAHAVQAAIDGSAVALADFAMVASDLSTGRLLRPFDLGIRYGPEFAYFLVYSERHADDPRIAAFRAWMLEQAHATNTIA